MKILAIKDSIITISGAPDQFINQKVIFESGTVGLITKATREKTYVVVDDSSNIDMNSTYKFQSKEWEAKASNNLLGKVINVYGDVLYTQKRNITTDEVEYPYKRLDSKAPHFSLRKRLETPLETGIFTVDSLIPIGRGQRELIIGDRKTGKTSIALSTIINQKGKNIKVVYVSIGQKQSTLNQIVKTLEDKNALDYTIVVAASPELKLSQYIAPYYGMALAESFAANNEDVLIVFDDLSKHANIYREISLNLDKPGGREAYPSDLFYLHSRLLERSGRFAMTIGGGSITALPIVETIESDYATLLATNVISITDGQILTDNTKAVENKFPAINIGLSVSRTGSSVQSPLMKKIGRSILKLYTQYLEAQRYELISLEVSPEIKRTIMQGKVLSSAFEQMGYEGKSAEQMFLMARIVEWDIINYDARISLDRLVTYAMKDKTGSLLIRNFREDENYSNISKAYFRSLVGQENSFGAKRNIREILEVLNGEN